MATDRESITICIPQWQVKRNITVCLRSIRRCSRKYDIEVIVVDNGSKDESLDYLRSLSWIRLIERPEETYTNWPTNVFTGWDVGLQHAKGELYVTMHSDVFVKADDWLDPLLEQIRESPRVAGAGAWKLFLENPLYAWQKRVTGYLLGRAKQTLGRKKHVEWRVGHYPRDYCALYRTEVLRAHELQFRPHEGRSPAYAKGGGYSIAAQLWDAGYETRVIPLRQMAVRVVHVAHGTAGATREWRMRERRRQRKLERRVERLFRQPWVRALEADASLDGRDSPPTGGPST